MMKKKQLMATALLAALPIFAEAQVTFSGRVLAEDGTPLSGVNIRIDNSLKGATTNGKGEFSLTGLSEGTHILNLSYVGFEPLKYTVSGSQQDVRIVLRESYNQLEQVVVTGTGTHRRMKNSPVPITVITAKDIMASNASSLEDALVKLSPSISTVTNGMGTTMSLNGINEDYFLILENGRRLAGDDRYTRINVANIKRIEILNGAASALYGSDAIGGVINIITDKSKNSVDVSNYTHFTSKGRLTENVNADVNVGRLSSYTSYQRQQADNWQNNGLDENGKPTGKPTSVGFYRNNVNQRFELKATDKLIFGVHGGWFDNETRRPQDATYFTYNKKKDTYTEKAAYTYDLRHETYNYGADMKYIISPRAYIDAEFLSDNFTSSYNYFAKSGKNQPGDEVIRKKTHYTNANVKGIFRLGNSNKLSVGAEYVNDQLRSESDNINFKDMYTLSVFAQDEITLTKQLQAVLGLRYIYNENFDSHATPNVSLLYRLGHVNMRAAYAAGFRTPTLSQLFATDESKTNSRYTTGNPGLKPEKNNFYSLNAEYSFHRFFVSVTGFINDMRDMINYRTLSEEEIHNLGLDKQHETFDEIRQRDNVDRAKTKGLSVNVNWMLGYGFSFGGGYTFMDTEAKQRLNDGTYEVTPIDKSVKHSGNLQGSWEHRWGNYRLNVGLQGHLQGERFSKTYGYAPKFQEWNLNTRHTFDLRSLSLEPGLGIINLFNDIDDRPWNSNFSTLTPGRSVYVSLLVRFKS